MSENKYCPNCKCLYGYEHNGNLICSACGKVIKKREKEE